MDLYLTREKEKEEWIFGFHTTVQKWKK